MWQLCLQLFLGDDGEDYDDHGVFSSMSCDCHKTELTRQADGERVPCRQDGGVCDWRRGLVAQNLPLSVWT
jgi:hypothetical protein